MKVQQNMYESFFLGYAYNKNDGFFLGPQNIYKKMFQAAFITLL